ncbi:hypothetical protein [Lysobacter arvi]|uniref:Uncharacterized protein n=1 Tax=Lysobacter arvi TaxID=3038776 RepID=A0ABU1CHH6_9GAMM|nr:hypothetical protein [Lysobacter arvi]MDR0184410.1 hypothetical protein [Lysobacter arvi]
MNVFTNLFFPQAQQAAFHTFDDAGESYAGYGNRIASARVFAPLGHGRARRTDEAAEPATFDELAMCGCG